MRGSPRQGKHAQWLTSIMGHRKFIHFEFQFFVTRTIEASGGSMSLAHSSEVILIASLRHPRGVSTGHPTRRELCEQFLTLGNLISSFSIGSKP